MLRFQSTFPRGERRFLRGGSRLVSYFNPRSLVGNDAIDIKFYVPKIDFNPRSLVGNDDFENGARLIAEISIHVPSWGTTKENPHAKGKWYISIHVPSWGTTHIRKRFSISKAFQSTFPRGERHHRLTPQDQMFSNFNPRSLVGNDGIISGAIGNCCNISIHVPSWGTTIISRSISRRSS